MANTQYKRTAIKGYEGLYEIDTNGVIFSLPRIVIRKASIRGGKIFPENKKMVGGNIVMGSIFSNGYLMVSLYDNNHRAKKFAIHRLVAETFLENPSKLPVINHKNEIKTDNRLENLEWCTPEYNFSYSIEKMRKGIIEKNGKPVEAYKLGKRIGAFKTVTEASKILGIKKEAISLNARGLCKNRKGYTFKFI